MGGWYGRRVLITGGAGFLGSSLGHALGCTGAEVTAIDNFAVGSGTNRANLDEAPFRMVVADLNTAELGPLCRGVDVLFNLAAQSGHMNGQADPIRDIETNAVAQLRLIQAMRQESPGATVVHASTRQIYGIAQRLPVDEAHPVCPPDANSVSKLAGEQYWLLEHRMRQLQVVVLRLTNCYGPRQYIRDASQSFLGEWIGLALGGQSYSVWGGDQQRDLLYVDDAIAALMAAAADAVPAGQAFNVGGAAAINLVQLARMLADAVPGCPGFTVKPMPSDRALIDIGSFITDDRRFRAATGWAPGVGVAEGLARTVDWFRSRLHLYG